jgi:hypothetical protein
MSDNPTLSHTGRKALYEIRALRSLPETSGTVAAERKILNQLNSVDTLAIALELAKDEEANWSGR